MGPGISGVVLAVVYSVLPNPMRWAPRDGQAVFRPWSAEVKFEFGVRS